MSSELRARSCIAKLLDIENLQNCFPGAHTPLFSMLDHLQNVSILITVAFTLQMY